MNRLELENDICDKSLTKCDSIVTQTKQVASIQKKKNGKLKKMLMDTRRNNQILLKAKNNLKIDLEAERQKNRNLQNKAEVEKNSKLKLEYQLERLQIDFEFSKNNNVDLQKNLTTLKIDMNKCRNKLVESNFQIKSTNNSLMMEKNKFETCEQDFDTCVSNKLPVWSDWSQCSKSECGVKKRRNKCKSHEYAYQSFYHDRSSRRVIKITQTNSCNKNSSCLKSGEFSNIKKIIPRDFMPVYSNNLQCKSSLLR